MVSLVKYSQALNVVMEGIGLRRASVSIPNPTNYSYSYPFCGHALTREDNQGFDYKYLNQVGLRPDRMPNHVAITLDGSRRWCRQNGVELSYKPFYHRVIMLGELCIKFEIPAVSCFINATCNWKRTEEAHDLQFRQLQASLEDNLDNFLRKGMRVSIIGEKWKLPKYCQDAIEKVEEATKKGETLHMIYAVAYGGTWDVVEAARSICAKVMSGEIDSEDIDETLVAEQLSTNALKVGDPDLMIRTGAKQRLGNFYLWQSAYAELYFSNLLSNDFGEPHFLDALRWFQQIQRRFGN